MKFYVRKGIIVDKVQEIISFKQIKWFEKYVNSNTQNRNLATSDFEKDFYQLFNNAFYGETFENVRNRIKVKLKKKL